MAVDVFIVAGVRLYRQGLASALDADARFNVVGTAAGHADGVAQMTQLVPRPDVALLDIGVGPGLLSARQLRAALPEVRLVALSIDENDESVVAWAEAGVAGFVTCETSLDGLMTTVDCVARGGARCSPRATAALRQTVGLVGRRSPTGVGLRSADAARARDRGVDRSGIVK